MEKLFLIKPGFADADRNDGKSYICPPCTLIEGILSLYPELRQKLAITYVDYARPRQEIVKLIGAENQSCPVLVFPDLSFIDDEKQIINYLAEHYGISYAH